MIQFLCVLTSTCLAPYLPPTNTTVRAAWEPSGMAVRGHSGHPFRGQWRCKSQIPAWPSRRRPGEMLGCLIEVPHRRSGLLPGSCVVEDAASVFSCMFGGNKMVLSESFLFCEADLSWCSQRERPLVMAYVACTRHFRGAGFLGSWNT